MARRLPVLFPMILLFCCTLARADCPLAWRPHIPAHSDHAATFDSIRGTTVIYGGQPFGMPGPDTWQWNGSIWHRLARDPAGPGPRYSHAIAFDEARGVTILYGGWNDNTQIPSDTWSFDGEAWSEVTTPGPGPRYGHAMVYDAARQRIVLFGGADGLGARHNDTWEWDGQSWTRIPVSGPSHRKLHALAYDSVRNRVVLFGGETPSGLVNDTWEWDGQQWIQITVSAPPSARRNHAMTFDPISQGTLLHGGWNNGPLHELWAWDGASWTLLPDAPSAREGHTMTFDSERNRIVLFGGRDTAPRADLWELDPVSSTWDQRLAPPPEPRMRSGAAFDPARNRAVIFGGRTATSPARVFGDTWEWGPDGWELVSAPDSPGPGQRSRPAMAHHTASGQTLLFGGQSSQGYHGDTWLWDGTKWTDAGVPGPSPRSDAVAVYDAHRERIVLFGGYDYNRLSDTWEWDGTSWSLRATTGPSARYHHSMAYDEARQVTVLASGMAFGSRTDTWEWDGEEWTLRASSGPFPRMEHTLVFSPQRGRILLIGGNPGTTILSDVWEWDGNQWTELLLPNVPPPRAGHIGITTASGIMLFGGWGGMYAGQSITLDDTWELVGATAPHILTRPEPVTGCRGSTAEFTIVATGEGLTYHWHRDGIPLTDGPTPWGSVISGAQSATLTVDNLGPADEGRYHCIVTNDCGAAHSRSAPLDFCYPNCDCSTTPPILTVDDFTCFINEFAVASALPPQEQIHHYANCDGSTTPPILTADDFTCFINAFAAGCP